MLIIQNYSNAQINGCTDPLAINYNASAVRNDGSCIYNPSSVSPVLSLTLEDELAETSGLIKWNNQIWTLNDNGNTQIYGLDTLTGNILDFSPLTGSVNIDWEEITQDSDYLYIGDFGNNQNGNRTDLKILRIDKKSFLANSPVIEMINFSYSDQHEFASTGANNTDFDCEAFVVTTDSIFLFTKQWISNKTKVYALPKTPGSFSARLKASYDVEGLITGATFLESKKLIVLSGYSSLLEPFIFMLYDFTGSDFINGNKRKVSISLPFHQIEGITTSNGLKYFISNEKFVLAPIAEILPKLHILDLTNYLEKYFEYLTVSVTDTNPVEDYVIYPVPAGDFVTIKRRDDSLLEEYALTSLSGQILSEGKLSGLSQVIDISKIARGMFLLRLGTGSPKVFKVVKE